ncbi:MAG: OmpA family protein [Bacteroidaceae bacterium]|nr:OmpA family protein [Bacteroidaceae bacterium]
MNAKIITTVLLGLMGGFGMSTAAAQEVTAQANSQQTVVEEVKANRTTNYWYIEAASGVQTIFSSDAHLLSFGKRLTPLYSLTAGKWVGPYVGFRLQTQGYAFNGFSTTEGLYPLGDGTYGTKDPVINEVNVNPDGSYRHYLRYIGVHADVQFSMFNIFGGVNENRRWDILPAVGFGYAHAFAYRGTSNTNSLTANASLMGKFRIINCLDLNMEVGTTLMPDHFDSRIRGRMCEPTLGLSMGLTYRFRSKTSNAPTVVYVPNEVVRVERDTLVMTRNVEKVVEKNPFDEAITIASVHFKIGKVLPIEGQEPQFANVVKFLKENPKARIRLDGYADKDTGTDEINMSLSVSRSTAVRSILINDYGIDASRIEAQALGANAQPYDVNEYNRVVLIHAIVE